VEVYRAKKPFESSLLGRESTHNNWKCSHDYTHSYNLNDSSRRYRAQHIDVNIMVTGVHLPPIPTSLPEGSSVSSIIPAPTSTETPPRYTADHMALEIRVLKGIAATVGILVVLGIFVPLFYAVIVGCLVRQRARKVAS
jgi:hypothetical protein